MLNPITHLPQLLLIEGKNVKLMADCTVGCQTIGIAAAVVLVNKNEVLSDHVQCNVIHTNRSLVLYNWGMCG